MTHVTVKNLILGGGISGISFAHFTKEDSYIVLEKEMTLGGLCRSFHIGESTFDFSGHFMHFKDDGMKKYITSLVNKHQTAKFNTYSRDAGIFFAEGIDARIIDYPFQANIHQLRKDKFIKCLVDLHDATYGQHEEPKTFDDLARNSFGHGIVDEFVKPYNEKLYQTPLEEMDANAMSRFIPKVHFDEVLENMREKKNFGYNSTFTYSPTSGIQGVVDALLLEKPIKCHVDAEVSAIDIFEKTVVVGETTFHYTNLINTLPLPVFMRLTEAEVTPIPLKSVDVLVYNITYTEDVVNYVKPLAWMYFPGDAMFYRVGFYNFMSGKPNTSIYVEVSKPSDTDYKIPTIDEIDAELKRIHLIRQSAVIQDEQILRIAPAYAILEPNTEKDVNTLKQSLEDVNVYMTGRYGAWKYQSIEDNILDAKLLAKKLDDKYGQTN